MAVHHPCLPVIQLSHAADIPLPCYETAGAAGLDLRAALSPEQSIVLQPGKRCLVPTGLVFELTENFEAQIRPRSGLAYKHGITCLNTPGTIDSDYRGEIKVLLINLGEEEFHITRGMRIAQAVIAPVCRVQVVKATDISETARGEGGFGSTGRD